MSDHYDYVISCEFPHTLSQPVIDTLRYMTRAEDYPFDPPLEHVFFQDEDPDLGLITYQVWRNILQVDRDRDTGHFARFFRYHWPGTRWGPGFGDPYILSFRLDVHDDAEGEYWQLLAWLATVSSSRGCVGYSLLQGSGYHSHPRLWYFEDGRLASRKVDVESKVVFGTGRYPWMVSEE